jgi:hypothetical protein
MPQDVLLMAIAASTTVVRSFPRSGRFACALASAFAISGAAHAANPDLAVLDLIGPLGAHASNSTFVQLDVWNIAQAYAGSYTAEILLSTDEQYDAGDTVIHTLTSASYLTQILPVSIPAIAGGKYYWIARILPVVGETNLANNVYVGGAVRITASDLSVPDDGAIVFQCDFQSTGTAESEIEVLNAGSANSVLIFTAEKLESAPWLHVDIGTGIAIQGQDSTIIKLTCSRPDYAIGTYVTHVRVANANNAADFQDIEVRLEIGSQSILLGDRVLGQISEPGETDEVRFPVLAGSGIVMTGKTLAGNLKLVATIFAPSGALAGKMNFGSAQTKKVLIANETGEYRMVLSGKGNTAGSYRIKTNRKNPQLSNAQHLTVTGSGAQVESVELMLYVGARLDIAVDPGNGFVGPVVLTLTDPDGAAIDISGLLDFDVDGSVNVEGIIAPKLGTYTLGISGFGAANKSADVLILPVQPVKGKAKVYTP